MYSKLSVDFITVFPLHVYINKSVKVPNPTPGFFIRVLDMVLDNLRTLIDIVSDHI